MISKAQKFRLGIFILLCSALLIGFFIIVAGNKLMERKDTYYIHYRDASVNGLQIGSSVKYSGINIGGVDDISIDKEDIRNVIVKIGIKQGTPIKEDVYATLVTVGITGLKQIELTGGSNEAVLLEPGARINAGSSYFDDITGKAEDIAEKLELLIQNLGEITNISNREKISRILANSDTLISENRERVSEVLENLNLVISENRQPIAATIANIGATSANLNQLSISANATLEKLNAILDSPEIRDVLVNTAQFSESLSQTDLVATIEDIRKAVNQINTTFAHVDLVVLRGRQDLLKSLEVLKETADYLNEFSRQISDDPSFLLRSKK